MRPGIKRKESKCPGSIQQMSWPSLGLTVSLLCSHQPFHLGLAAPSLQGSASKAQLGPQPFAGCPSLLLGQVQTELASHWPLPAFPLLPLTAQCLTLPQTCTPMLLHALLPRLETFPSSPLFSKSFPCAKRKSHSWLVLESYLTSWVNQQRM